MALSSGRLISMVPKALPSTFRVAAPMMEGSTPVGLISCAKTGASEAPPLKAMRAMGIFQAAAGSATAGLTSRRPAWDWGLEKTCSTAPISATLPESRMATRLQICSMTDIWWVMRITVMPCSRLIFCSRLKIWPVVLGSRAEVASSHSSTSGSEARARAMAMRCFWPPESCTG